VVGAVVSPADHLAADVLKAGSPEDFQHKGDQRRRPDDCGEHPTHQIGPCRRLGEPSQGDFEVLGDQTEVLACLTRFERCEVVIIWHTRVLGEDGYPMITRRGAARPPKHGLTVKVVISRAHPSICLRPGVQRGQGSRQKPQDIAAISLGDGRWWCQNLDRLTSVKTDVLEGLREILVRDFGRLRQRFPIYGHVLLMLI
jgi:hypothetical protein